jgi:hypothetical protein
MNQKDTQTGAGSTTAKLSKGTGHGGLQWRSQAPHYSALAGGHYGYGQ